MKNEFKSLERIKVQPFLKKYVKITSAILILLLAFLFLPWQQTIKGEGILIAYNPSERNYKIYAPIEGFIKEFKVGEDQFVKKGQPLFEMIALDPKYLDRLLKIKDQIKSQLKDISNQVNILKNKKKVTNEELKIGLNIYKNKIFSIKEKIKALKIKKEALEQNLEITILNYKRIKILYEEGIESRRKFELEKNKLAKAKADLENIKIQINIENQNLKIAIQEKEKFIRKMKNKLLDIDKNITDLFLKQKSYKKELQKINSKIAKFQTSKVLAKEDGYVVRILQNDKNQFIKKGQPILIFNPTVKKRAILVKVPEFDMPLVKKGLEARIWFYGWPAVNIPGWPAISHGTYKGIIEKVDPIKYENNFYYAFAVEPENDPWPDKDVLRLGTKATVWIRLSTVPIWYELWRKVNAFPPIMVNPQNQNYQEKEK